MPSGTFVIYHIVQLPKKDVHLKTKEKSPAASLDPLADSVYTSVRLTGQRTACGYSLAKVRHRRGVHIHGFWRGNPVAEVVEEMNFHAFYSRSKQLFISNAERHVAEAAVSRLSKELPKKWSGQFCLEKIQVDFEPLLGKMANVVGVWFRRKKSTPIHSQAAFGNRIGSDPEYRYMAKLGTLRNLIMVLPFKKKKIKVAISAAGSLYFMDKYDLTMCLGVVEHLNKIGAIVTPPPQHRVRRLRRRKEPTQ